MKGYEIITNQNYNPAEFCAALPWECLGHSRVTGRRELLLALAAATARTKAVAVLWDFADPDLDISAVIAKALRLPYLNVSKDPANPFNMPHSAVPFVGADAAVYGYYLESGKQCIVVLSSLEGVAEFAAQAFLVPYFSTKIGDEPQKNTENHPNNIQNQSNLIPNSQKNPLPKPAKSESSESVIPKELIIPPGYGLPPEYADSPGIKELFAPINPAPQPYKMTPRQHHPPLEPPKKSPLWDFDYTALEKEKAAEAAEDSTGKPKKKSPLSTKIIAVFASILVIFATAFVVYALLLSGAAADKIYAGIREKSTDFSTLSAQNPDFAGWLKVGGTAIDYPVVIPKEKKFGYYSNHLFSGLYNKYGTPRLPEGFSAVDYCRNTVITAENYGDGRMFSEIENYLDAEFLIKNPTISYQSEYYITTWRVIGVVISADNSGGFDPALSAFADDSEFEKYLKNFAEFNLITTDTKVDSNDVLLTLIANYSGKKGYKISLITRKLRHNETVSDPVEAVVNGAVTLPESADKFLSILPDKLRAEILSNRGVIPVFGVFDEGESEEPSSSESTEIISDTEEYSSPPSSRPNSSVPASSQGTAGAASSSVKASSAVSSKAANSSATPSSSAAKSSAETQSTAVNSAPKITSLTVKNQNTKAVVTGAPVDIIAQIVEAEMGSGFHIEALKAQAVTALTWVLNQDGIPSVPMKTPGENSILAAKETANERVFYDEKPAYVYYFAMSAGRTAPSVDTWLNAPPRPYLVSVDSSFETTLPKFQTTNTYRAADVAKWVKAAYGIDLPQDSKRYWFDLNKGENRLYVKSVNLCGLKEVAGSDFRAEVLKTSNTGSSNAMRSHAFDVSYNSAADIFIFTVKGFGHGVGMSQEGANLMAKSGKNYKQILKHYFPGTSVKS